MHPDDNVGVVGDDGGLPAGTAVGSGIVLVEPVPQAHKVALRAIGKGEPVRRYNVVIGTATTHIAPGQWVHEHLLALPDPPGLEGLPMATAQPVSMPPLSGYTFQGYRNRDGSVGTRNVLGITTTVQCVAAVVEFAVRRIKEERLSQYPNVDDVVALGHTYGCGVAIDAPDAAIPIRTLRNIGLNPNFGNELLVVSLGCEKLQPARLLPPGAIPISAGTSPDLVRLQDDEHDGFLPMVESIVAKADAQLARLNRRRRETCSASELVVGLQCGGSDALSGVTANPAIGFAADLLVRAGATVMFSENTEVRDAVDQLTARSATPEVASDVVREMAWYDAYLERGAADRAANTTPGNKMGGLSNIVEKAMGSIVKSGSSPIVGVLPPGDRLRARGLSSGLVYAATPASDFICGTLQLAAGMTVHVFSTGRGTPYGLPGCPVVKVATRSDLARRWHDLIDVNARRIADGEADVSRLGWEIFELILEVASGRKTWAEHWHLQNALVLFNPAPVT
jgi:galactarate dehydratase